MILSRLARAQAKQARAFGRKAGAGFANNQVHHRKQMDPDTLALLVRTRSDRNGTEQIRASDGGSPELRCFAVPV